MVTQDEIITLNKKLNVKKFLESLGAYNVFQLRNKHEYRCPCWFRNGDNPSGLGISFNADKGKWICTDFTHRTFSCIDLITLATKHCNMTFLETIKIMHSCVLTNGGINSQEVNKSFSTLKCERMSVLPESLLFGFSNYLHPYLKERGFLPKTAKRFELGFSCFQDYLQDRITIPIRDENGQLVSIQGRTTIDDKLRYMFFDGYGDQAKRVLYNLDKAKEAIQEKGYVILVEGATSVWRLWQYGIDNVVATLSTSVTEEQINLLINLNVKIICFFDFDKNNAGQIATVKLGGNLRKKGFDKGFYYTNIGNQGLFGSPDDLTFEQVKEALLTFKKLF